MEPTTEPKAEVSVEPKAGPKLVQKLLPGIEVLDVDDHVEPKADATKPRDSKPASAFLICLYVFSLCGHLRAAYHWGWFCREVVISL